MKIILLVFCLVSIYGNKPCSSSVIFLQNPKNIGDSLNSGGEDDDGSYKGENNEYNQKYLAKAKIENYFDYPVIEGDGSVNIKYIPSELPATIPQISEINPYNNLLLLYANNKNLNIASGSESITTDSSDITAIGGDKTEIISTENNLSSIDKSYNFSYSTDKLSRNESSDSSGNIQGQFSYVDEAGIHNVSYKAGDDIGFLITGGDLISSNNQENIENHEVISNATSTSVPETTENTENTSAASETSTQNDSQPSSNEDQSSSLNMSNESQNSSNENQSSSNGNNLSSNGDQSSSNGNQKSSNENSASQNENQTSLNKDCIQLLHSGAVKGVVAGFYPYFELAGAHNPQTLSTSEGSNIGDNLNQNLNVNVNIQAAKDLKIHDGKLIPLNYDVHPPVPIQKYILY